jgi:ABC-type spermidine/putrescine transport system permease subunit II
MRMIVVSLVVRFGEMRGIITTIHKHGAVLVPVATPIVYAKCEEFDGNLGDITSAHPLYAQYKKMLEDTMGDGYAKLIEP